MIAMEWSFVENAVHHREGSESSQSATPDWLFTWFLLVEAESTSSISIFHWKHTIKYTEHSTPRGGPGASYVKEGGDDMRVEEDREDVRVEKDREVRVEEEKDVRMEEAEGPIGQVDV